MSFARAPLALVAGLAILGAVGCGSAKPVARQQPATSSSPVTPASTVPVIRNKVANTAAPSAGTQTGAPAADGKTSSAAPSGAASPSASPSRHIEPQVPQASESELPIKAHMEPACVAPAGTARLVVHTLPKAGIAYVAVYNGNKSGAAKPWGDGYGGNDKGIADSSGDWSSTWVVAPTTPKGPAYVLLVVGLKGKQRQIEVPFAVGTKGAGC